MVICELAGEELPTFRPVPERGVSPKLLDAIVGSLACDGDVVNVTLAETCAADANEARLFLHFGDAGAANVAHAALESTDKLVDHHGHGAAIGHAAFDAFGDEFGETVAA